MSLNQLKEWLHQVPLEHEDVSRSKPLFRQLDNGLRSPFGEVCLGRYPGLFGCSTQQLKMPSQVCGVQRFRRSTDGNEFPSATDNVDGDPPEVWDKDFQIIRDPTAG
jgi:hypothetical protein